LSTVAYRCVCGEVVSLDTECGGCCQSCQRKYSPGALNESIAQTISLAELRASPVHGDFQLADEADEDDWVGRELEHYQIVERLGRGGMGQVYRALDQSLQRYVAIKVIHAGKSTQEDSRQLQRLFQEATAQARVNHPNIAHIYYVGRDSDAPFLAMELVDGRTLAEELEASPLSFARIVDVAIQVADALRHAIEFDIVHGDIKPTNILITRKGTVKLADFGLARRLSDESEGKPSGGTPRYLAPEIAGGIPPNAISDMYSLGVTLFQLSFGRLPYTFSSETVQGLLQTHRDAQIEFPPVWPPDLPERWREILTKLLAKLPADRYQSYDELMIDLQQVRPVNLPSAGRLQRGLAWLLDMALVNTAAGIIVAPVAWMGLHKILFPAAFLGVVAPILAGMLQARWGTTPGKKLFQIRIVDRYGLVPGKATLGTRLVPQVLPVWAGVLAGGFDLLGAGWVFWALIPIAWTITGLDAAWTFLRPDRRSVHDLLFGTRVALDA